MALRARTFFKNILRLWRATLATEEEKNEKHVIGDERVTFSDLADQVINRAFKGDAVNGVGVVHAIEACQPVSSSLKKKMQYEGLHMASALSKIFSRLGKLGKSPIYLMEIADTEKKGTGVAITQFFSSMEEKCGIYLNPKEALEIKKMLDPDSTGK